MNDRMDAAAWTFDAMGAEFDTHVAAHLPGYADVQRLVALIGAFTLHDGATVADIGASTGMTAALLRDALPNRALTFHLYDADQSMLDQAAARLGPDVNLHHLTLPGHRPQHTAADLTLALWLLQFLHPGQRRPLLADLREAAAADGCLIVATKTRHADSRWEEVAAAALDDYKADHGVGPSERVAKTAALRGTMHTVAIPDLTDDMLAAGWHSPALLWRWHFWAVIGAWANPPRDA